MTSRGKYILPGTLALCACAFVLALHLANWSPEGLFLTADQRGGIAMARKEYDKAAWEFEDPMRRGAALYRAGDFKDAAAAFGQDDSAEAVYNRANALVMLGSYQEAMAGYRKALALKPGWKEAADNLELADQREKRLHPPDEGDEGTGGELPPDKIDFDRQAANAPQDQKETVAGGERRLSDAELRAMWLRRVQTSPADFLRAKFAYQAARKAPGAQGQEGLE
ncbi:tetratricopeptide repeat protein [Fundidesulfovibrio agrisoli]|uniref:tetratricopeptide repeat protein n=1 Tax=Fundidesulfovibrio agrisoli TaxID=2922717 RepID=UPI001FAC584E|nr:tetratricopeptide repeat protein [Fundidesulfovibrio agrisoli]